ncbi:MAG: hypothetical protein WBO73_08540 [Gammaproteobacteria bacterium]|jgi:hypothetical protein
MDIHPIPVIGFVPLKPVWQGSAFGTNEADVARLTPLKLDYFANNNVGLKL